MITGMKLQQSGLTVWVMIHLQNLHNKMYVFDTRTNLEFEMLTKRTTQSTSDDIKVVQALNFSF